MCMIVGLAFNNESMASVEQHKELAFDCLGLLYPKCVSDTKETKDYYVRNLKGLKQSDVLAVC